MSFRLDRSRRRLLITAAWAAMTAPGAAFSAARAAFPVASTAQRVVSLFSNASSAAEIGRRYLADTHRELTPDRVLAELDLQNMAGVDNARLRRHLAARSSADYEEGRTVRLDGWILSHTEVRRCALAAMLGN